MLPVGFEPATPASDQPQTFALDPVPTVQGAGWAPGPVWTGAENFVFIGIRYPDRPARSESLYRLGHLGRPLHVHGITITSPMWNAVTVVLALCVCVCVCGGGNFVDVIVYLWAALHFVDAVCFITGCKCSRYCSRNKYLVRKALYVRQSQHNRRPPAAMTIRIFNFMFLKTNLTCFYVTSA